MISSLRKYVTVEPTFLLTSIWYEIFSFMNQNLYLQKGCHDYKLSAPDLSAPCDDEKRGLVFVSTILNNITVAGTCWAVAFLVYASYYSDTAGGKRKVFLLLPIVSMSTQSLWALLQVIFWDWSPLGGVIGNVILEDAFGGLYSVYNFVHAIVLDRTAKEHRLYRITILGTVFGAGHFIGKACAGYLLINAGYVPTIILSAALLMLALVCAVVLVEDTVMKPASDDHQNVNSTYQTFSCFKPVIGILALLFPKKPGKVLASLWILILIILLHFFPTSGERSVIYLYFRYRFHWNEEKYSVYSAFRLFSVTIGGLLCTLVMKKLLKIPEAIIGAFAAFCDVLAVVGCYFAAEDWQLYTVALFDMFHGVTFSTASSLLSQYFTEQEYGRLVAMNMLFLVTGSSIGVPLYGALFRTTMDTHPAVMFLLSAFLHAITCVMYSVVYFVRRSSQSSDGGTGTRPS